MKPGHHEALRRAIGRRKESDGTNAAPDLEVAYMRILCAVRTGSGVRLTAEEVWALVNLDSAISLAAENIESELLNQDDKS